jgi:hypothetical protein
VCVCVSCASYLYCVCVCLARLTSIVCVWVVSVLVERLGGVSVLPLEGLVCVSVGRERLTPPLHTYPCISPNTNVCDLKTPHPGRTRNPKPETRNPKPETRNPSTRRKGAAMARDGYIRRRYVTVTYVAGSRHL